MPTSKPPDPTKQSAEPRAFVLRVRQGHGARGASILVTVDDVLLQRAQHFTDLETAFSEIRKALNLPGGLPGQPH